jgi:pimeloyl-ACP methyl ester carboxylesterase
MPYADSGGVRIHYQVEGAGPPLVLQHGFYNSLQNWYDFGYVDALKPDYRLILVDARGHGASDKPHDPDAYKREDHVADILAVLDELGVSRTNFFGYSMGAAIAFAMAHYAADRVSALIIGGGIPYPLPIELGEPALAMLRQQGAEGIPAAYSIPLPPAMKARLVANDVEALIAWIIAALNWQSLAPILPRMTMPCLVYVGEADPFYPVNREFVAQMPNATFFSLPGLGHAEALFRSDLVLPHVTRFLRNVNSQAGPK